MVLLMLQIVLYQGLFLILYDGWLQKETFFTANRWYLLITSLFAIMLPVGIQLYTQHATISYSIPVIKTIQSGSDSIRLPVLDLSDSLNNSKPYAVIWGIYILGITVSTWLFARKIYTIFHLIHKSEKYKKNGYTLVVLQDEQKVFSFLHYIFIGKEMLQKNVDYFVIHESVHVKQKHSWDLLWFEWLKIGLWFSPFVYLFQRRAVTLHEYIADENTLHHTGKDYFNHLLNNLFQVEKMDFVNQFYIQSLIKKRIIMLNKNKSKIWKQAKYLMLVPIVSLAFVVSVSMQAQSPDSHSFSGESMPFDKVDVPPVFPGCEDVTGQEALKACFSSHVAKFISEAFDYKNVDLSNNSDEKIRFFSMFIIDKQGKVTGIKTKAATKSLMREAQRSIATLPKMIPAKHQGKSVAVRFTLPMLIQNRNNKISVGSNKPVNDSESVPYSIIEEVPVYPGCEDAPDQRRCFSENIQSFVAKNFNIKLADKLGLTPGKKRIFVMFKIDAAGKVSEVKARAPHPDLEMEAIRVIRQLPVVKPGKSHGNNVGVKYSLPITFTVKDVINKKK